MGRTPYAINLDVRYAPLQVVDVQALEIDLEGRTVTLMPRQAFTVPRGVLHRTRAPERTVVLMIEGAGVMPTGD